jgi:hypothetical protein
LWSAIFASHGKEVHKRRNNEPVEGFFQKVKDYVETNPKLSKKGTIEVGRYIEEDKIQSN